MSQAIQPRNQSAFRAHIGLSVRDLSASVAFYRQLFGVQPVKQRPGYAKFLLEEPALNLSLVESPEMSQQFGPATHFGLELGDQAAVTAALQRVREAGLSPDVRQGETCCYAVQDKFWATDPDGHRWEHFFVTQADTDTMLGDAPAAAERSQSAPGAAERSQSAPGAAEPSQSAPGAAAMDDACCPPTCCNDSAAAP